MQCTSGTQSIHVCQYMQYNGDLVNWTKVRCVSRSVEGLHSLVARILKRAPAAKTPYLSFEMRWKELASMAYTPAAAQLQLRYNFQELYFEFDVADAVTSDAGDCDL